MLGSTAGSNVFASVCGSEYKDKVISVVRGACLPWADHAVVSKGKVHSGAAASYLIAHACKLMTKKEYNIFVAYSDPDALEIGGTYQSVGWKYCGMTHATEKYTTLDGKSHDSRQISGRTRDRRGGGIRYKRSRTEEKQLLIEQGCTFSKGTPKYRYVSFYGDKQTKLA